jgi:putative phosphoribosyl transferase
VISHVVQSVRHGALTILIAFLPGELNRKIVLFASRQDAGRQLGEFLRQRGISADGVLGLPRGGVVVAAEVARTLQRPLDVLIVRKIGHPWQREFAVGALAEPDVVIFDESLKWKNPLARAELDDVIAEEKERLREYRAQFHRSVMPVLEGKTILLVDDGLATGATAEAAVISARRRTAGRVIIAAPVASTHAVERLRHVADEVAVLMEDPDFEAVGQYYARFSQTTDAEVKALLHAAEDMTS